MSGRSILAVDGTRRADVWGCLTSAVTPLKLQTGCNGRSLQQMHDGQRGCISRFVRQVNTSDLEKKSGIKTIQPYFEIS